MLGKYPRKYYLARGKKQRFTTIYVYTCSYLDATDADLVSVVHQAAVCTTEMPVESHRTVVHQAAGALRKFII